MAFTSQQNIAIRQHNTNMIVTAGAGSGKTRVLIERFLALLRANPDWKITQIVAITFTEKAAREMRERLRGALQDQALKATKIEIQQRWHEHETLLESAYISTIHALCQQILREHPARVPVDPGFTILDENEAALLIREAIDQTLAAWVTLSRPWAELLYRYDPQDVKKTLASFIERSSAAELNAAISPKAADILNEWRTQHQNAIGQWQTEIEMDAAFGEALNWQPPIGWENVGASDKLLIVWEGVRSFKPQLTSPEPERVHAAISSLIDNKVINLVGGAAKNWGGDKELVAESKALLKQIREKCSAYLESYPAPLSDFDSEAARLLPLWVEAIQDAAAHYSNLKNERAALDFDDLEALTLDLLENDPNISAYYQAAFQQIMVDEFQDTNQRQRRIVECLCGTAAGRLFVVGDPKQSIYAFRGADVSVFNDVKAEISTNGHEQALNISFRTHKALVEAFNACFNRLLTPDPSSPIYPYEVNFEPLEAHRPTQSHHYYAFNVMRLDKGEALAEDAQKLSSADLRRAEAAHIAAWLQHLTQEHIVIYDKNIDAYRPFHYGDAAVLLRSFTDVNIYEDGFKAAGLPYITLSGRGYFDRQEVWDILNLLRALHNPADELALASALRSPLFGLSDEALYALRLIHNADKRPIPLMLALNRFLNASPKDALAVREWSEAAWGDFTFLARDESVLSFAADALQRWRGLAGRVAVADLIETILTETAYDAILSALPDGDRRRGNLDKLLQQARASGRVALGEFLRYMQDLSSVEPREGEAAIESLGAVQIMTVHRSKGLEFPVVVVADASREPRPTNPPLLLNDPQLGAACLVLDEANEKHKPFIYSQAERYNKLREEAENKRLFYVATTRAADYLLVSGTAKSGWLGWLDEMCKFDAEGTYTLDDALIHYRPISIQPEASPPKPKTSADAKLSPEQALGREGAAFYLMDNLSLDELLMVDPQTGEPPKPPLIDPLPPFSSAALRHLSVTQLEQLGSISAYDPQSQGARRFRHSLLHDAPPPLRPITQSRNNEQHHARLLGRIVHRALQTGAIPSRYAANPDGLTEIIGAYAWDAGFTEEKSRAQVVAQALNLLQTFGLQGEPETLARADGAILREVPFIYQMGERVLHGVVDALYQIAGQWHVLDYKTPPIRAERASQHAQRYAIQLGAYARAVEARTGQIPITQIYYLHAGVLVTMPPATWQAALDDLDTTLQNALRLSEQED